LLDLGLPKIVLINNWRLRLWYNIAVFIMAVVVVLLCAEVQAWTTVNKMDRKVHSQVWAPEPTDTQRFHAAYKNLGSRAQNLCKQSGLYDFQLDRNGDITYFDHSCVRICEPGLVRPDCYLGTELVHEGDSQVFFPTEMFETVFGSDNHTSSPRTSRYWVPVEDA